MGFTSRCSCVFYAVPCAAFFSPYQDGHKNTNHSKLNDSTCADFMALRNLDNYQEEVDPRTFHHLRWSSLWLWHKKVAVVLKYTFTNVAGPLDLLVYKCNTEETLKVPRVHNSFQKVNTLANFWSWFWWNNEFLIYKSRSYKCSSSL